MNLLNEKLNIMSENNMTKEELLEHLQDIEWENFEVKTAKTEVPKDVWETVSAFSNTSGGWIVFGVAQKKKAFEVVGVDDVEK
jgi:ATP-dependent DNA helicase RecG